MCLLTTHKKPKIANEDIVCYKIYIEDNNKLYSLFMKAEAPLIGEIETSGLSSPFYRGGHTFEVERGFHSFSYLKDIKCYLENIIRCDSYFLLKIKYSIFKCVIPKGSLYYKGYFDGYYSYCSENIKLIEVCV